MSEYELYHHGIKGQKWGVRRTAAQLGHRTANTAGKTGKALYKGVKAAGKTVGRGTVKVGGAAKRAAVAKIKQTVAETKEKRYYDKLHKKKLSQMTDKEIKDLTNRVKREAELKDAKYESKVQNARKFYKNVAQQPVNTFLATYSKKAIESAFKDNNSGDQQNQQTENGGNTSKPSNSKKPSNNQKPPSTIEFEVVSDRPQRSSSSKPSQRNSKRQSNQAFDDYFEAEVRREQERKKNPPIIRR